LSSVTGIDQACVLDLTTLYLRLKFTVNDSI
jgi:hypothetical protein